MQPNDNDDIKKDIKSFIQQSIAPDVPFSLDDITSIEANIATQEIVELIRESRAEI